MSKCDTCGHKEICIHKTGYTSLVKKIDDAMPGEEMVGMGDKYPFSVDIKCKHYVTSPDSRSLYQQLYGSGFRNCYIPPRFWGLT